MGGTMIGPVAVAVMVAWMRQTPRLERPAVYVGARPMEPGELREIGGPIEGSYSYGRVTAAAAAPASLPETWTRVSPIGGRRHGGGRGRR